MFTSLSLKISIVQCIENSQDGKNDSPENWLLLEQKHFVFLCSFLSAETEKNNKKKKRKKKLYIASIETRKQLVASDMHL